MILYTVQVTLFLLDFIFHQRHFSCSAYSLSRCINWLLNFSCIVFAATPLMQCTRPIAYISELHLARLCTGSQREMSTAHCVLWSHFTMLVFWKGLPVLMWTAWGRLSYLIVVIQTQILLFSVKRNGFISLTWVKAFSIMLEPLNYSLIINLLLLVIVFFIRCGQK